MNPTQLIYNAAGQPPVPGLAPLTGNCYICGAALPGQGQPVKEAIKDTFNDRDKAKCPDGPGFCPACVFTFTEQMVINGKENQRFRNYSHLVAGDTGWEPRTKGEKAKIKDFLLTPHGGWWLACIAESGQKHLAFRCPVNFGFAPVFFVQFEERRLKVHRAALGECLRLAETMLGLGFSKAEIESGQYLSGKLSKVDLVEWQRLEDALTRWRGNGSFSLALFLAQKAELEVEESENIVNGESTARPGAAVEANGGRPANGILAVNGLEPVEQPAAKNMGHPGNKRPAVRHHDNQPAELRQLSLFEDEDQVTWAR